MTTVYDTDEDGNIIVAFDTRWRFPETLGFSPEDPEYRELQGMWERATGRKIREPQAGKLEQTEEEYADGRTEQRRQDQ